MTFNTLDSSLLHITSSKGMCVWQDCNRKKKKNNRRQRVFQKKMLDNSSTIVGESISQLITAWEAAF